jgi:hypothetical protein
VNTQDANDHVPPQVLLPTPPPMNEPALSVTSLQTNLLLNPPPIVAAIPAVQLHLPPNIDAYTHEAVLQNPPPITEFNPQVVLNAPPPIVDFKIACSVEESKALGSGYNVSYFICIY